MEVVIWGVVASLWWISTLTFLLPIFLLLRYSKRFRDWWFSSFFLMGLLKIHLDTEFAPVRKKAFELLKDNLSQGGESKPLKVLEIGIGSGPNLEYYPENSHLIALDMKVDFGVHFHKNEEKYPNIKYEKTVISLAENMKDIDESSMDVVISTYVLCSVSSYKDVVKEVKRVLKPGGKFLFLEHVGYPKSSWGFTLQRFVTPLWNVYIYECCLLRHSGDHIKNAGFSNVICRNIFPRTPLLLIKFQIYGVATK